MMQVLQVMQIMQVLQAKGHKKTVGATNGFKIAESKNNPWDYFFLCLIILSFFFLLCVAILCFFLFLPQGTAELLIVPESRGDL